MTLTTIALNGSVIIFLLSIIFHLLVVFQALPYSIVWGGRLKTKLQMYRFEFISIFLNILFLCIMLVKSNNFILSMNTLTLNIIIAIMAVLFFINTIGNLLSKNKLEKRIFTPVTAILTVFCIIIVIGE